ncbi:hypothetical protein G7Y79_00012g031810 [Physcia stellaris]|nr:hypothetical protein G7Y79_00012g031810 [Physcia stellaris]
MDIPPRVDVLITGAGPVGLLTAYILARSALSTLIIEQRTRTAQLTYGRAAMLAPRSLELLDQLELSDALLQLGFAVRGQVHYRDGERVDVNRYASSGIEDTYFDFLLLVRQRYTEQVLGEGYAGCEGRGVQYGARLRGWRVFEGEEFAVEAEVEVGEGVVRKVRCRYLVGADGGRSTVREMAGIHFAREKTSRYFIRIDGVVKTDMPEARKGLCGVESKSHGSVLWACLDHRRTRVGFAFPQKLWEEKGANLTQEDVVEEAKKALEPFTLEFETVDWWTAYSVGQGLADNYRANERIFIAGDAAHTHSSAAAQGMNTGLHDAVNLSWKLAGAIRGWFTDSVLESYTIERRFHAQKIIEQDKIASMMTAGEVPEQFKDDPNFDIDKTLSETYSRNQALNTGIGVQYPADGLTLVEFPNPKVSAGDRAPDALLQKPGMRLIPVRLYSLFKNTGKFTILVFAGDPVQTASSLKSLREYVDGSQSWERYSADLSQSLTIMQVRNEQNSAEEKLGVPLFGQGYYDVDASVHDRYGVDSGKGAVVVLRPDATIGTACGLEEGSKISTYFAGFVKAGRKAKSSEVGGGERAPMQAKGEVDIQAPGVQDWADMGST